LPWAPADAGAASATNAAAIASFFIPVVSWVDRVSAVETRRGGQGCALDRYRWYSDTDGIATTVRLTRAERQARTRDDLVAAAERLFTARGFHATSVDAVADEAGFTKGAVYSNFASKEDLFFAVYERRAEITTARVRRALEAAPDPITGIEGLSRATLDGRGRDDGWLAVFFEFWAHVLRHPELRERFAQIHRRVGEPLIEAAEQLAAERGAEPPMPVRRVATAQYAMQLGLQLERLTQPEVVDADLAGYVARRSLEDLVRGGSDGHPSPREADSRRGRGDARREGAGGS
jgi:AcrR family transcriptional regulator